MRKRQLDEKSDVVRQAYFGRVPTQRRAWGSNWFIVTAKTIERLRLLSIWDLTGTTAKQHFANQGIL